MNLMATSDLHIIHENDDAHIFFKKFVNLALRNGTETVVLLGDIFDFMVGNNQGYLKDYNWYFKDIEKLLLSGIEVYVVEGNHDFHLEKIYEQRYKDFEKFNYISGDLNLKIGDLNFLFMHGDDLDLDNPGYKKWKEIYTSNWFKTLVNNVLPYPVLKYLGGKASTDSKKRNSPNFDYEKYKIFYREKVLKFIEDKKEIDILVAGHTHIEDKFEFESKIYVNNGYPAKTNKFIYIQNDIIEVRSI